MAFDQKTRNLLQRTVTECRRVFDREFTAQLQEFYGIQPDGTLTPLSELDHLADEQLEIAGLLRSRINHLEGGEPAESVTRAQAKPEHVARVIREQAFTVLNRLAALRLSEERGLVLECVRRGVNSEGFQLFMTTAGNALGETHEAYRVYLYCLFDELALDLGVLFDRFSPLALLFPRKDALEEVLHELNGSGKAAESEDMSAEQFAEIWKADEAIGWIYQYYNDEAERKKMRDESSAPRNSRELAVRNQFFTPRYVVEFLTDNTLGRLWYEMTRGETVLRDRCRYLVRRPAEIFLKAGEAAPASNGVTEAQAGDTLTQEELLQQPVHVPYRALKDPREILLLDPACGSMHFGLYAFDLFIIIYDEAWEIAHGPDDAAKFTESFAPFVAFAGTFSDKAAFRLEVPRLIIERNIHGIDIDPRAAQIAGLSLWLRAQRAWHETDIKPSNRPPVTRSNIVCAEPMPGEKALLREFVEQQFETGERPAFAFLLEKIFDRMTLAGEAGSLLRIEEEIRSAIAEASVLARSQPEPRQSALFPGDEGPEPLQLELQGLVAEQFWQRAEQRIYDALEAYAKQTETGDAFQRRLFADDAAQGFAFIDLSRKRYDIVVMNPPFGSPAESLERKEQYPYSGRDIYAMFVERMAAMRASGGRIGAILPRTGLFIGTMVDLRVQCYLNSTPLELLLDLGMDVLDGATIRTACYVIGSDTGSITCIRIGNIEGRETRVGELVRSIKRGEKNEDLFIRRISFFNNIPGSSIAYWIPERLADRFPALDKLEALCDIRQGIATGDNFRFLRLLCEIAPPRMEFSSYSKGGEPVAFVSDETLYVQSSHECAEMKANAAQEYGSASRTIKNEDTFGLPGITYSQVNDACLKFRVHPPNALYDMKGPVLFPRQGVDHKRMLAFLNSQAVEDFMRMMTDGRQWHVTALKSVPVPDFRGKALGRLDQLCEEAAGFCLSTYTSDEAGHFYTFGANGESPKIRREGLDTISSAIDEVVWRSYGATEGEIKSLSRQRELFLERTFSGDTSVDQPLVDVAHLAVGAVFGRWDIRFATGERTIPALPDPFAPLPVCPPGMLQGEDGLPISPEAGQRLRSESRYPLDVAWNGILVDDPDHSLDVERHVHGALAVLWVDRAELLEQEACALIGVRSLREWFRRPGGFFADHLKRYSKSRRQAPIYWPLSTPSGRYTLWLYYHRLTPDTLYRCLQQFVLPKLADVEKELTHLRTILAANEGGAKEGKRLEELEGLRRELIEFRTELELWAPKWRPNLNDGVLISAAPLWKLFRLPKWQKDLKACWQALEKGDYDWAHLAYSLWPDRVREKCKTDLSLAIAHGLEELCEVKVRLKKTKKSKTPKTEDDQQELPKG
jgi:hypothetical protein